MNNSDQFERRAFPRISLSIPMLFLFPGQDAEESLHATAVDASLTGIYCTINKYIPPFTRILVTLLSPAHDERPNRIVLQSEGVVVRIDQQEQEQERTTYALALYFPHLSEQDREALQELIDVHTDIQ